MICIVSQWERKIGHNIPLLQEEGIAYTRFGGQSNNATTAAVAQLGPDLSRAGAP